MADQIAAIAARSICSASGLRSEASKRAWKRLKDLDRQGIPSFNQLGPLMKEAYKEVRAEAEKGCLIR